jgi:hypothetical protein
MFNYSSDWQQPFLLLQDEGMLRGYKWYLSYLINLLIL